MYQAKEVDFLVATDAIGMGLNMDINHVAFAGLSKFDGHRIRHLHATELAQIAGRAGRGMADGSFGTTAEAPGLGPELAEAIENHRFDALDHLYWRNGRLDFSGLDALLASLEQPSPGPGLVRGADAADHLALAALARDGEIRDAVRDPATLRLLWEACQVPDYRRLGDDSHARLCGRIFHALRAPPHRLAADYVTTQLAALDRADGDLDTLMARISGVRTWAYVAARPGWVEEAEALQAATRALEDRISDALHERLTTRFVDRRAAHLIRRLDAGAEEELLSAVTREGAVVVEGHGVGRVEGFVFHPDPEASGIGRQAVLRAARRALGGEIPRRVAALEAEGDEAFSFTDTGRIAWRGADVARLAAGADALRPLIVVPGGDFLDGAQRERIRRRLAAWLGAVITRTLGPLLSLAGAVAEEPALRGLAHRLGEGLGVVPGAPGPDALALRGALRRHGVRLGRHAAFLPGLLRPGPASLRARLWAAAQGLPAPPPLPRPGAVSVAPDPAWPAGFAEAMGFLPLGPVLVRLDVAERIAGELAYATRAGAAPVPAGLASRLGCRAEALPAVLRALGFSLRPGPGGAGQEGAVLLHPRRRPARSRPAPAAPAPPEGPFAALAALRAKA
jgi:ATP-dependent RNA helicase SUPV3L1/SUV3